MDVVLDKIDPDDATKIANYLELKGTPESFFFVNGRQVERLTGAVSEAELQKAINNKFKN